MDAPLLRGAAAGIALPALRSCWGLAQLYPPLARRLFHAAFVSCWTELHPENQDSLIAALTTAFKSPSMPGETLQLLLNLAEFMEHDDKALPIDIRTLGSLAEKCHAYAKALHYKELEFQGYITRSFVENPALMHAHAHLQQHGGSGSTATRNADRGGAQEFVEGAKLKAGKIGGRRAARDKGRRPAKRSEELGRCIEALISINNSSTSPGQRSASSTAQQRYSVSIRRGAAGVVVEGWAAGRRRCVADRLQSDHRAGGTPSG